MPVIALGHDAATGEPYVTLTPGKGARVWWWTVRSDSAGTWKSEVLPGDLRRHRLPSDASKIVVTAVSRTGIESRPAAVQWRSRLHG